MATSAPMAFQVRSSDLSRSEAPSQQVYVRGAALHKKPRGEGESPEQPNRHLESRPPLSRWLELKGHGLPRPWLGWARSAALVRLWHLPKWGETCSGWA